MGTKGNIITSALFTIRTHLFKLVVVLSLVCLGSAHAIGADKTADTSPADPVQAAPGWTHAEFAPPASIKPASVRNLPLARTQPSPQRALFDLVNHTRRQAGVQELVWDDKLADAAWDHAKAMAEQGVLSHQLTGEAPLIDRLTTHNARLDRASENVVYDITAEGAHDAP